MNNLKTSFTNVRQDILGLQDKFTNWIFHLNNDQKDLRIKLIELENRLRELEQR